MDFPPFSEFLDRAVAKQGGLAAVEEKLTPAKSREDLAALPDSRWLSEMAKRIFQAGFSWTVIENKWPDFEEAFDGFEPRRVAMYADEDIDRLLADKRIVRNGGKIRAVIANARMLVDLAEAHGSASRFFADWPDAEYVGLLDHLKRNGSHLGGISGPYVLRMAGKSAFILSADVNKALIGAGIVDKAPSGKRDMARVQEAFNQWSAESGRDFSQISRILALSV